MTGITALVPQSAESRIDALVARYCVVGAERRRKRRRVMLGRGAAAVGAVGLGVSAWVGDWNLEALRPGLEELRTLRSTLTSELEAFSAGRAELQEQRAWLEQQTAQLSSHLSDFERQAAALETQRSELREQTARLEAALVRVDLERRSLLAAETQRSVPQQTIDEIDEQQQGLEQRREESVAQQNEVSSELDALTRRRQALEQRRVGLEEQRRELEALLGEAGRGRSKTSAGSAEALDSTMASPVEGLAVASSVNPGALGDMRGGIMLGGGMNVSIGLTRSASINGVEQITNTFALDGMNRSFGMLPTQPFEPFVIQNGLGNSIDSRFLGGVTNGYGTILQNTLDDQIIDMKTIFDVSIRDVSRVMDGVAAGQALRDSLYFQQ